MTEHQRTGHQIDIGAHVHTHDGKGIGKVDKVIVHGPTGRIDGFLLDPGMFGHSKIVEISLVASSETNNVVLTLDEAAAKQLPEYIEEQFVKAPDTLSYGVGFGGMATVSGGGDHWFVHGQAGGGMPQTGATPFFFQAPIGNVETENITSIGEDSFFVSEGTDVVGSDGKKVGNVDQVLLDDNEVVTGIIVKTGMLHRHHYEIPRELIAGTSHKHVRLSITAAEAEQHTS